MVAYKLFRRLKDGSITSLFINRKVRLPVGEWLQAYSFPTKGFAVRPYWHCMGEPTAPHLTMRGRVWLRVEMDDFVEYDRPQSQGNKWYLAKRIKIHGEEN